MNKHTAQFIFIILNILAVMAVGYAVYDFYVVNSEITFGNPRIIFDTGTYYLLSMSIFWVLSIIQFLGLKSNKVPKNAKYWVVGWFIFMFVLANLLTNYVENRLSKSGYYKQHNSDGESRISKGESSVYIKGIAN